MSNITSKSSEKEVTIYGIIKNTDGLKKADKIIEQEQYEIKPDKKQGLGGKIRVRKETIGEQVTYEMTVKVKQAQSVVDHSMEYTVPIDSEMFQAFKSIASSGMIKTRYVFNIKRVKFVDESDEDTKVSALFKKPDAAYEVDVFHDAEGFAFGWCKIDLELDVINDLVRQKIDTDSKIKIIAKISKLPFKPENCFIGSMADERQKLLLDDLYTHVFTVKM
jgi:hypothetical protein